MQNGLLAGLCLFVIAFTIYICWEISGGRKDAQASARAIAGETWNIASVVSCMQWLKLSVRSLDGKREYLLVFLSSDPKIKEFLDVRKDPLKIICFDFFPKGLHHGRKTDIARYLRPRRAV